MSEAARRAAIQALVAEHFPLDPATPPPAGTLPLALPTFGAEEVAEAIDSLLTGWVTMGEKVRRFEESFAAWVGVEHAVMVNSGSSALLVMLSALVEQGRLVLDQEVVVPAVGWSTSLFAVHQAGLTPVLVDVDADTLCLEGTLERPALAVHLLGQPSQVQSPLLLEDACGAHGATVQGRRVGSLGHAGCFSFFFSHHMTTIEGGMVVTDDAALADRLRSVRAHGWIRERTDRAALAAQHPDTDPRFLFVSAGYNLRPTEISGAFGMHQMRRIDDIVAGRTANHEDWCAAIADLRLPVRAFPAAPGTTHVGFGFPLLLSEDAPLSRPDLCAFLEARGIATRAISGSNLARQPALQHLPRVRIEGPLPVADAVHERGLFVGQGHTFGSEQRDLLCSTLREALG